MEQIFHNEVETKMIIFLKIITCVCTLNAYIVFSKAHSIYFFEISFK